ncbi:MAG: alpha/beta hydrolase family protein [Bacteroidota bacterium]
MSQATIDNEKMSAADRIHHDVLSFLTADKNPIEGDLRYPDSDQPLPLIVICHSFMAFKDWGFFPYMGTYLARAGFATFTFNFSYNGLEKSGERITNFDKFERNTFTRELDDCHTIITGFTKGGVKNDVVDPRKIIFLGHSRGAGIAIVAASRYYEIKALVSLSPIATFDRWTDHQKRNWRKYGYLPLASDSSVSPLKLGIGVLKDLEWNGKEINITDAASKLALPWLIMHGKMDITVSPREAEQLYASADKTTTELILLDKIGHLYNASTEAEDHYTAFSNILDLIISWLNKYY